MAVPWVRLVRVLRHAVTFHLPVGRHADGLPTAHIVVRLLKALRTGGEIARIVERPDAIEAAAQRGHALCHLHRIGERHMVAVGRQAVLLKERGVCKTIDCKHQIFLLIFCRYSYLFSYRHTQIKNKP